MSTRRAYFTPDSETVSKLTRSLLFGEPDTLDTIEFVVDTGVSDEGTGLPSLEEVVITPVWKVCVTHNGYEISGDRGDAIGVVAKLLINTTVDPPVAVYEEIIAEA